MRVEAFTSGGSGWQTAPRPEQITSGPTSEEGIAMAPDGRSLITAVGLQQTAVWLRDAKGERQISIEGRAFEPIFSADGNTLFYVVNKAGDFRAVVRRRGDGAYGTGAPGLLARQRWDRETV
jgi:hypothetical protein